MNGVRSRQIAFLIVLVFGFIIQSDAQSDGSFVEVTGDDIVTQVALVISND